MPNIIPGTIVDFNGEHIDKAFIQLEPVFSLTGGLTLAQVKSITGLEASTIQNWIRRGWVPPPVSKLYSKQSLLRILLINSVRGVIQIDKIAELMSYINGDVVDTSDDIISDEELFNRFCGIVFSIKSKSHNTAINEQMLREEIDIHLEGYEEKETGSVEKLQGALFVMVTAYLAAQLSQTANNSLEQLGI